VRPLVIALGLSELTRAVAGAIAGDEAATTIRRFPDGETYVRLDTEVRYRHVVIVADLAVPDEKIVPLLWTADTARDLGAARVGLVAPYLPYMRQDARFQSGEGITSRYFARVLSSHVDWLVTVDPHLHRYRSLDEVYGIPSRVQSAAPLLARWIDRNVRAPLVVGPDAESEQWVRVVADAVRAPCVVLTKTRVGDREVRVSLPDVALWRERTPVLIDDVISTGGTMVETVRAVLKAGMAGPVCLAVHGIFVGNAHDELMAAGCRQVVTCNTVPHPTNGVDAAPLLVEGVRAMMDRDVTANSPVPPVVKGGRKRRGAPNETGVIMEDGT
jgi:ribose-phosphate pyrophosphokinase